MILKLVVLLAYLLALVSGLNMRMSASKNVLIVGGTRFSGLYLWKELHNRGHNVALFNRGKTSLRKCPRESDDDFEKRKSETTFITGDRKDVSDMTTKLSSSKYDVVYDLGGRESSDTEPLVDIFGDKVDHFVYMSSAGVYKKSLFYPHTEESEVDYNSRHKGKLNTEEMLKERGVPFTSIRPTYIYGPYNYNPIEEFFFERLDENRRICVCISPSLPFPLLFLLHFLL
jgi:nucleoside-diphosphate-sugar epimerase